MPAVEERIALAPAKLNLTLHVTGQRADGYHLLDSLVIFADIGDRLSIRAAQGDVTLQTTGPYGGDLPPGADNLVLRAARLIGARNVAIRLDKRLPVAAGMGGGSADAAATLRLLAHEHGLALPGTDALIRLGADLPVCLAAPQPCRMRGLGEVITPLSGVPDLALAIVNPGIPLATPAVFKALSQRNNPPMPDHLPPWPDVARFSDWLANMRNDLEGAACTLLPDIRTVITDIARQPGCLLARMTGSGATCFGIFADFAQAEAASTALARPGRFTTAAVSAHTPC
ncbi:MAG: 4-(cytidine 5'-diphospho)-2-C-methyl-D-erythritol kinase [Pararhodobacter sp.]|nr:4-(cytidine 5'-diphospho)-2-C-methyl-D-erythritol kinase [Pararhodobacter sp.]